MDNSKALLTNKEVKKILFFCAFNFIVSVILLFMCHNSKSMALTAFTYLTIFDLLSLFTAILNIWIQLNEPTNVISYGYKRCEVLAVFTCLMLSILSAFFTMKESIEAFFEPREVHTGRLIPAIILAYLLHFIVTSCIKNKSFEHVIQASTSSWLQEHVSDLSEGLCRFVPSLSKLLLPRINPFALLGFACLVTLIATYSFLQMGSSYLADAQAAILISIMTFGTMLPMAIYTGKILLQTTPSHMLAQLDKCLREASTLDGVLEFRNEHFWTLTFGIVVGSLHVRVRRDADEQLVLAHVWNKLAGLVQILTIHIFKDDWIRRTTHQLVYNSNLNSSPIQNVYYSATTPPPPSTLSLSSSSFTQQQQQANYNPVYSNQTAQMHVSVSNPLLLNNRKNASSVTSVDNDYIIINP